MRVFIGMETSGELRRRFLALGHDVKSCDLLPSEDGDIDHHMIGDVLETLKLLRSIGWWPDLAIFHPTCTFHTVSAAWAFNDPDFVKYPGVGYHQRVKPDTFTGQFRRAARDREEGLIRRLAALPINIKFFENPIGTLSTRWRKPTQIVQPYQFGDDASKATCFWIMDKYCNDLPELMLPIDPALYVPPTLRRNGKYYWSNQTDTGQNRLSPDEKRWKDRSRTFPGIANAIANKLGRL